MLLRIPPPPPWARGHVWTTWPLGRFSRTLHFIVTTHFALYSQTLQYQEEGVLLQCYFEFFCTAWGLNEWRAGYWCTLCSLGCTASCFTASCFTAFCFTAFWLHCISIVYSLQVALIQCFDVELRVISTGYCKEYFYSIGWILLARLWGCLAFSPAPAFSSQAALSPHPSPPLPSAKDNKHHHPK